MEKQLPKLFIVGTRWWNSFLENLLYRGK